MSEELGHERVSVIGCGYLGATHAACMAELGFEVLAVETLPARLEALRSGTPDFHETGLEALVRKHLATGRLAFTDSLREAADFADCHFICVGTPQQRGNLAVDLSQVLAVVEDLSRHITRPATIIGKSTVPVGTSARLLALIREHAARPDEIEFAWNPEFLREGHALQDTMYPERLVFGVASTRGEETLRRLFRPIIDRGTPVLVTSIATAEIAKTAANSFLAMKISFINAISEMCDASGADVMQVSDVLGLDSRIGRRFLDSGLGYGGACLVKDTRALVHRADELGAHGAARLMREVDNVNTEARERLLTALQRRCGDVAGHRVAVLGLSFKPLSDDIRESPALWVANRLVELGASVSAYDPAAMPNARAAHPALPVAASVVEACEEADAVLLLTEWEEFETLDPDKLFEIVARPVMIDARNVLDRERWRAAGWDIETMGRP